MMTNTIEVTPAREVRREFAQFVSAHSARTSSPNAFLIGTDLFPLIPDPLLTGARVDGQPWIDPTPSSAEPSART